MNEAAATAYLLTCVTSPFKVAHWYDLVIGLFTGEWETNTAGAAREGDRE